MNLNLPQDVVNHLTTISNLMYEQVAAAARRVIDDCTHEDFKAYLEKSVPTVETLVMFHASCVYTRTDKQIEMQRMLFAQLQQLTIGFVLDVVEPKGFGYTAKFVERMKVDDSLTLFGENVVREAEAIAENVKTIH